MENSVQGISNEGTVEDKVIHSVTTGTHPDGTREGMRPNKQCFKPTGHNEHSEQLFPRLPNEITFGRIVPKLPWTAFHMLAAVSPTWRKAIRDHRVHDARIHSCSTDTLAVHAHDYDIGDYNLDGVIRSARIAVYSVRDKLCYDLPPVPGYRRGAPSSCECVSLDGRIYVLGGAIERDVDPFDRKVYPSERSSSKVYVLDLAGASHWKECASMERGRQHFGCAVFNGKIYVFGGNNNGGPTRGAEVYNPKVNAWSPITPLPSLRYYHRVFTVSQQIFVHGGRYYHPSYHSWKANGERDGTIYRTYPSSYAYDATYVEVYNPMKDKWTDYDSVGELDVDFPREGNLFMAQGKLHWMHEDDISVYKNGSWTHLKGNEFPSSEMPMVVLQIVEIKSSNELLAGVMWYGEDEEPGERTYTKLGLCESEGFGTENNTIVWNVVSTCPGVFGFMHCIQL